MENSTNAPKLKKHKMSLWTILFMLYCLCAGGVFGIEEMIPLLGPGLTLAILLVMPVIYGYPIGIMCAELGAALPDEGGFYTWPRDTMGEFWGFQAGWWRTIGTYIDNSLYIILAGAYITSALNLSGFESFLAKVLLITVFTIINLAGLKEVGLLSSILAIVVLIGITGVTVVGFANWNFDPFDPFLANTGESTVMILGAGLTIGMWLYCGYESMSAVAGELENPQIIPKALVIIIPVIAISYFLPTMTGIAALGHWDEWSVGGEYTYASVLTVYVSPVYGIIFLFLAVAAMLSLYNSYLASGSRGFFVMAEDYLAPPILAKLSKSRGTPYVAIISMAIVNAVLCNLPYVTVVVLGMFMYMFSLALIMFSGIILRKTMPDRPKGAFKIPLPDKALIPLTVVPIAIMVVALYTAGTDYFLIGMTMILTGPLMYVIWKKKYGGLAKIDSEKYPIDPKTKLGLSDYKQMAKLFFISGVSSLFARVFLPWFEADWEKAHYELWDPVTWFGEETLIEVYSEEYWEEIVYYWGFTPEGLNPFYDMITIEGMQNGILVIGVVATILAFVCWNAAKKVKNTI